MDRQTLRTLSKDEFLRVWRSVLLLVRDLHPENAIDHGKEKTRVSAKNGMPEPFRKIVEYRFLRSGWPVELAHIGHEAWRRQRTAEVTRAELYAMVPLDEEHVV
jgi:hypothetical protein